MNKAQILNEIEESLRSFDEFQLIGIADKTRLRVLARQILDSVRRVGFTNQLRYMKLSPLRKEPYSQLFDPIKAAINYHQGGNYDEACWLVFLFTIFGKSKKSGWRICRDIYGALGQEEPWTWKRITTDYEGFCSWYQNASLAMANDSVARKFGGHRQYESLRYDAKKRPLQKIVRSYIDWVGSHQSHVTRFEIAREEAENDPYRLFDNLYISLNGVLSFGRLSKFDFISMLSKIGLIDAYPPIAYLKNATGPLRGVNLLFFDRYLSHHSATLLEDKLSELAEHMKLGDYEKQILEDALCNWQKDPNNYQFFSG
jgi:hypothetical protein